MNNERVKILSKLRLIRVILASVYRCEGIVKSGHHKNVPLPLMHMNAASRTGQILEGEGETRM